MPGGICRILAILACLSLSGCGFFTSAEVKKNRPPMGGGAGTVPPSSSQNIHAAIPAPEIPPELRRKAVTAIPASANDEKLYTVTVECASPDEELCELFENASRLAVMNREGQGRATLPTLEQRLKVSVERDGRDILHSLAYYDGQVSGDFKPGQETGTLVARVDFTPGRRYRLGKNKINLSVSLI